MAASTAAGSLRLRSVAHAQGAPDGDAQFIAFKATMRIPIAPVFASRGDNHIPAADGGMDGVREVLAGWVMRYLPPIRAVLLSFTPTPRFLHPAASFPAAANPFDHLAPINPRALVSSPQPGAGAGAEDEDDEVIRVKTLPMIPGSGFTLADVEWEGVGWRPRIGMKLVGTLTLSSPSHVSLLLHNLFNASIPSSHVPSDTWVFDPDCPVPAVVLERRNAAVPLKSVVEEVVRSAEKSVEGENAETGEVEEPKLEEAKEEEAEEEGHDAERGWWVHRATREPLGGKDGRLEFTLVDLTTTNSLLSCTGSLLADPFSPAARAALTSSASAHPTNPSSSLLKPSLKKRKRGAASSASSDEDEQEDPAEASSSESDSEGLDADDDDRVGTGIPRTGRDAVPRFNEDESGDDDDGEGSDGSESSRSPSPLPPPVKKVEKKADKKEKKDKKREKKDKEGKEGRKSKKAKVKAEP
ncbi:hypothetical protein Rhopal_001128-T1 [Rhodotorula paludigena]|uniref:RPA43 OB domain-containing protein n=1 Tax=Rhodotorula paludigena TaxID=86838 RepID=A0AAV5GHS0_9BASI|nr:hypothetical protein Rhopal_001128-T1 [Rhodotorula paludigena]